MSKRKVKPKYGTREWDAFFHFFSWLLRLEHEPLKAPLTVQDFSGLSRYVSGEDGNFSYDVQSHEIERAWVCGPRKIWVRKTKAWGPLTPPTIEVVACYQHCQEALGWPLSWEEFYAPKTGPTP